MSQPLHVPWSRRLDVDAWVVSGVDRAGLSATGAIGRHSGAVQQGPRLLACDRLNAVRADAFGDAVAVLLICRSLSGRHTPRICSDTDVKHGYAGDTQRSGAGFRCHQRHQSRIPGYSRLCLLRSSHCDVLPRPRRCWRPSKWKSGIDGSVADTCRLAVYP